MTKIMFVVTEDWFFASHFLPMAREANRLGFEVLVATHVQDHAAVIEAAGARVVPIDLDRRSISPIAGLFAIKRLSATLRAEQPAILHCISLKPILFGGVAAVLAGVRKRVFALTGWGYIGARTSGVGALLRVVIRRLMMGPLRSPGTVFLFENEDDPETLGLNMRDESVVIIGGAGIDPISLPQLPLPETETLKIAIVSRMLWSKGIDHAVRAIQLARSIGANVELSLFGSPDLGNPKAISEATLREWSKDPGIKWYGATSDVVGVWREHHVACLPSRGGEGLPRTLLESASCGRLSLTTEVAGCRTFVRHRVDGFVLPVGDISAFASAIVELAADRALVAQMGAAAAERVRNGFTMADTALAVGKLYQRLA